MRIFSNGVNCILGAPTKKKLKNLTLKEYREDARKGHQYDKKEMQKLGIWTDVYDMHLEDALKGKTPNFKGLAKLTRGEIK